MKLFTLVRPAALFAVIVLLGVSTSVRAIDCNNNSTPDAEDIAPKNFGFETAVSLPLSSGLSPRCVALDDIDRDGDLDVVAADRYSNEVSILRNDGTVIPDPLVAGDDPAPAGSPFQARLTIALRMPTGSVPNAVIVADIDGNGFPDVITSNEGSRDFTVILNQSDDEGLRFGDPMSGPLAGLPGSRPVAVAAVNVDGDEDLDLAIAVAATVGEPGEVVILINEGFGGEAPGFVPSVRHTVGREPWSMIAADLDGDGDKDLATANHDSHDVTVLWNDGSGGFQGVSAYATGLQPNSLAAVDLDGDHDLDLVSANEGTDDVTVLENFADGRGRRFRMLLRLAAGGRPYAVEAVDLDKDEVFDLAVATRDTNAVVVYRNAGRPGQDSEWFSQLEPALPVGIGPVCITAGDLNGDEIPDLAVANRDDGTISLLFNHTTPPVLHDRNRNGLADECESRRFHRGDPNNDRQSDISDARYILDYLFRGTKTIDCMESADVNNDGVIDLSDPVSLLRWLFNGGAEPAAPGPATSVCGPDTDAPGELRNLGCVSYESC